MIIGSGGAPFSIDVEMSSPKPFKKPSLSNMAPKTPAPIKYGDRELLQRSASYSAIVESTHGYSLLQRNERVERAAAARYRQNAVGVASSIFKNDLRDMPRSWAHSEQGAPGSKSSGHSRVGREGGAFLKGGASRPTLAVSIAQHPADLATALVFNSFKSGAVFSPPRSPPLIHADIKTRSQRWSVPEAPLGSPGNVREQLPLKSPSAGAPPTLILVRESLSKLARQLHASDMLTRGGLPDGTVPILNDLNLGDPAVISAGDNTQQQQQQQQQQQKQLLSYCWQQQQQQPPPQQDPADSADFDSATAQELMPNTFNVRADLGDNPSVLGEQVNPLPGLRAAIQLGLLAPARAQVRALLEAARSAIGELGRVGEQLGLWRAHTPGSSRSPGDSGLSSGVRENQGGSSFESANIAEAMSACKRISAHATRLGAKLDRDDGASALARLVGVEAEAIHLRAVAKAFSVEIERTLPREAGSSPGRLGRALGRMHIRFANIPHPPPLI